MKQQDMTPWIIISSIALVVLVILAFAIQKPEALKQIPFIGPSPTPTPISSGAIILTSPKLNEHISQKFLVTGKARVFENVVSIRLKDTLSGEIYGETTTTTNAKSMDQFGDFQTGILLTNPQLKAGTEFLLEVYQSSPKDGSEINKIVIPLIFTPIAN